MSANLLLEAHLKQSGDDVNVNTFHSWPTPALILDAAASIGMIFASRKTWSPHLQILRQASCNPARPPSGSQIAANSSDRRFSTRILQRAPQNGCRRAALMIGNGASLWVLAW